MLNVVLLLQFLLDPVKSFLIFQYKKIVINVHANHCNNIFIVLDEYTKISVECHKAKVCTKFYHLLNLQFSGFPEAIYAS